MAYPHEHHRGYPPGYTNGLGDPTIPLDTRPRRQHHRPPRELEGQFHPGRGRHRHDNHNGSRPTFEMPIPEESSLVRLPWPQAVVKAKDKGYRDSIEMTKANFEAKDRDFARDRGRDFDRDHRDHHRDHHRDRDRDGEPRRKPKSSGHARDMHDLAEIDVLDRESILRILKERYEEEIIHTYIGHVIIIVNPNRDLGLYGDEYHERYTNVRVRSDLEPHIFWVADQAYLRMNDNQRNQVILVSGESGSGKTENTKLMIKHLTEICQHTAVSRSSQVIRDRIVKANPLLEAFGNAKTGLNHNSSRFGKFVELFFTETGQLTGAFINDYLLEKSRVVHQGYGERNFHIFYYLFAGLDKTKPDYFMLEDSNQHRIMNQDGRLKQVFESESDVAECAQKLTEVEAALKQIGFTEDDVGTVKACLSAVLFLTNIDFDVDDDGDVNIITNMDALQNVSELLCVDIEQMTDCLMMDFFVINGESVPHLKTGQQARDGRDALAKALYFRLFGWIVMEINNNLKPVQPSSEGHRIGILDLSGFENLHTNSFEQLCINIANEKLQFYFNKHIFSLEQDQYEKEGINWHHIEFKNNDDLLELCLGKTKDSVSTGNKGYKATLFGLLDDQCKFPKTTSETLLEKWKECFPEAPNFRVESPRDYIFSIDHYADDVQYDAANFLEKNRDKLSEGLRDCMKNSQYHFIQDLFSAEETDTGGIARTASKFRHGSTAIQRVRLMSGPVAPMAKDTFKMQKEKKRRGIPNMPAQKQGITLSMQFRNSLTELMKKMDQAQPLFVRCVKPSKDNRKPGLFDDRLVRKQLQYNGVLEVAKIRKMGYPVRLQFRDFVKKYHLAAYPPGKSLGETAEECEKILRDSGIKRKEYEIGNSKVLMKENVPEVLRQRAFKAACIKIQTAARGYLAREERKRLEEEHTRKEEERKRREAEEKRKRDSERSNSSKEEPAENDGQTSGSDKTELPKKQPVSFTNLAEEAGGHKDGEESIYEPLSIHKGDDGGGATLEETSSNDESSEEEFIDEDLIWDVAQIVPRERLSPNETFGAITLALKCIMYVFLFLVVFVCSVTSTSAVLLLEGAMTKDKDHRDTAQLQLTYILCFPYVMIFIIALVKTMFGNVPSPPTGLLLFALLIEVLHCLGLVLLFFQVMPHFGSIDNMGIMFLVCLVPALLKMLFTRRAFLGCSAGDVSLDDTQSRGPGREEQATEAEHLSAKDRFLSAGSALLDLAAFLLQAGGIAAMVYSKMNFYGTYRLASTNPFSPNILEFKNRLYWQIPASLALVSLKWWDNFIDKKNCTARLYKIKELLNAVRPRIDLWSSFFGIGSILGWIYLMDAIYESNSVFRGYLVPKIQPLNITLEDRLSERYKYEEAVQYVVTITPALIQISMSLICYYFATLACKLLMQRFSFCMPLLLAPVGVVVAIYLQCDDRLPLLPTTGGLQFEFVCHFNSGFNNSGWFVFGGIIWWASAVWITVHIWFPREERLALLDKLFVGRLYTGPLLIQSLMLNRRKLPTKSYTKFVPSASAANTNNNEDSGNTEEQAPKPDVADGPAPMIYLCATMWHETKQEMMQLMKSIFRMDMDQCARRNAQRLFKVKDPDFYEMEAHILFDDAMEIDENEKWVVNQFVKRFLGVIDEAASAVLEAEKIVCPPRKVPTPYGGQLVWDLPGGNSLIVHLKDKNKIRHRKRWSQVMYMYYLLGYRLFGEQQEVIEKMLSNAEPDATSMASQTVERRKQKKYNWVDTVLKRSAAQQHYGKSQIFNDMDAALVKQSENTFILALDGDVDFKPEAVILLVDRMKKNKKTGAACGRIHPIGSGPMVWYQKFEYAVGHWFQKATEHVLGCVLCSPGCFSLFRGSALMDDNIMKMYTTKATEASHFLQYDQGEDRWLCTLLLMQGYRVDYAAASDALTYCPDGFNEFFNQRRRWMPSTLANIIDLLGDAQNTVMVNDNISFLYILYQGLLLAATVLGPGTIILAIATAFEAVLHVDLWVSYVLSILPVLFYITVCFVCKTKTQLAIGALMSTLYAVVMVVVLVGIIQSAVTDTLLSPSLLFTVLLTVCFMFAGIVHPYEIFCLAHGILYYLAIPAGYLILTIYSISNMHVVSWGTREVPKRKTKKQLAKEQEQAKVAEAPKKAKGMFSFFRPDVWIAELRDSISSAVTSSKQSGYEKQLLGETKKMRKAIRKQNKLMNRLLDQLQNRPTRVDTSDSDSDEDQARRRASADAVQATPAKPTTPEQDEDAVKLDDPNDPNWIKDEDLTGKVGQLSESERLFWDRFIKKYLKPLKKDAEKEKADGAKLLELRTNASFALWMLNFLWIIFNYMIQVNQHLREIKVFGLATQPAGFVFMVLFVTVLAIQLIGMIIHRWGTFMQVLSITEIPNPFKRNRMGGLDLNRKFTVQEAIEITQDLQKAGTKKWNEPAPDYDLDDIPPDYDDEPRDRRHGPPRSGIRHGHRGMGNRLDNIDPEWLTRTLRQRQRQRPDMHAPYYPQHQQYPPPRSHRDIEQASHAPSGWSRPPMSRGGDTVSRAFGRNFGRYLQQPPPPSSRGQRRVARPRDPRDDRRQQHPGLRRRYTRGPAMLGPNELERQLNRRLHHFAVHDGRQRYY